VAVRLNHTIVWCRDNVVSSTFMTDVLGLAPAVSFGPFQVVEAANGVSLDFHTVDGEIVSQHYAFLIDEDEFDGIFARITARGIDYWADPMQSRSGVVNRNDGGRGVYFEDPDGHLLEIITRPYGSGG
jgi:catechol 2,3-dioxygenase-like lactoylglutathione lyase family enzyme